MNPARAARTAALLLAVSTCSACSASASPPAPPPSGPPAGPSTPRPSAVQEHAGRVALAAPREAPLPFVLQAFPGATSRAVLAIASEENGVTWGRRLDGAAPGIIESTATGHVYGAFPRSDGGLRWVTAEGSKVCVSATLGAADRACVEASPSAVVAVADRLALLEVRRMAVPSGPVHRAPRASPGSPHGKPPSPAHPARKGAKREHAHAPPSRGLSHPSVEVWIRWIEADGTIATEAVSTDLHFEAPLDGMTLADARARGDAIDVLWYETAVKRKTRSPLGSGRLMAASLKPDGKLDFASRVAVADADLEFGQLKDHRGVRLVGADASVFLDRGADNACEAMTVRPAFTRLEATAATCSIDPDRFGGARALLAGEAEAFTRILADDPRRAFGQPKTDPGLVAWATDRGFYLRGDGLRSAARTDGTPRDEPPPFPARRASIAWGTVDVDGEAVAAVDGKLVRVGAAGGAATVALAPSLTSSEIAADRRMTARIGDTVWRARGLRARISPVAETAGSPDAAGAGHARDAASPVVVAGDPDSRVLVGGRRFGLSIETSSGRLVIARVDAAGTATPVAVVTPSPITIGFDAGERAAGGALVAGVTPLGQAVAFVIDARGQASTPKPLPLPLVAGQRFLRVVPLPSGGALVMDLERRNVVWIDDDARPLGDAPWPIDASDARCPFGRPMRRRVPGVVPREMIEVPGVASAACIVGDAVWGADGSLRWLGGTAEGLDFTPELAVLPLGAPSSRPPTGADADASADAPAVTVPPRPCPPEMVSIAGKYCVDRFEASIVDQRDGRPLSPDYPTTPNLLDVVLGEWSTARERTGSIAARAFPLPWITRQRIGDKPIPVAVSRFGARPSGYLTGVVAASACAAAGKRLCTLDEFVTACRGEAETTFPYGDSFVDGTCNVFRDEHPAALLHGNASMGHLDPRLDRVLSHGQPLLRLTGETSACRSRWGDDGVYDMVGNIDEWVDEGAGAFAGGFYSRSTRSGCDAVVTNHPKTYLDYSTGVRCCKGVDPGADIARPPPPR